MRQHSFTTQLKSLTVVFGIALAFASCANDDLAQNGTTPTDYKGLTAFSTGTPTTRTSMKEDGTFYWEAGDKIYVKDDGGTWHASSNSPTGKTASFKFMVPGTYTAHNSYDVYYPGKNGTNDQVTIPAAQTQTEPNTTAHFGASGDCGMASASRIGTNNQFNFTLDHKAAYLHFLPRTSNDVLHYCYLTKIEVISDNDIADTYTLDKSTDKLTGTGIGNQIVLTTKATSGTYNNGFPLTNNTTNAATNGAYMIIKPGAHALKIRYWVKDVATNVEGMITKDLPLTTFGQNKYYNITADLQVENYDGDHYYMWDAQEQFWKGHEWWSANKDQSVQNNYPYTNGPSNNSDPRYYNGYTPGSGILNPATHAVFKDLLNYNEAAWYVEKGDPRWDADRLWATMGHLYKGGIWFKKKAYISGFNANSAPDGTDFRFGGTNSSTPSHTLPSASEINKYFYLPALGCYSPTNLQRVGEYGMYWTSTASNWANDVAFMLQFTSSNVVTTACPRHYGLRVQAFE